LCKTFIHQKVDKFKEAYVKPIENLRESLIRYINQNIVAV